MSGLDSAAPILQALPIVNTDMGFITLKFQRAGRWAWDGGRDPSPSAARALIAPKLCTPLPQGARESPDHAAVEAALGEVTKYLVYNRRKRQEGGDTAAEYFNCTQHVAGIMDMRFQVWWCSCVSCHSCLVPMVRW